MTMKEGGEVVKAWLKAELDDYVALQGDLKRELGRIRPKPFSEPQKSSDASRTPVMTLNLDEVGLTFSEAAKTAIAEITRTEGFRAKRRKDYEHAVAAFLAWTEKDIDLSAVTPDLAESFKTALTHAPARGSVRPLYRDLPWRERIEQAKATGESDLLNAETINTKYLSPLRAIYRHHQKSGLKTKLAEKNPFDGVAARKRRGAKRDGRRRDFTDRELRTMFRQPMFTGALGSSQAALYQPGDVRICDWRYWVPLISIFTGARLNEVCAIALSDFRIEGDIHYVLIRDVLEGQNRKSDAAWRRVPLHKELIKLRLPDYVEHRRREGGVRLFDDLQVDAFGYVSSAPSKFFNRLTQSVAEPDPEQPGKLVFYSTRHTVVGRLRSAEVRLDVSKEIVGHEDGDTHSGYGGVSLEALKKAIDKIEYEGLNLSGVELPISVLARSKS